MFRLFLIVFLGLFVLACGVGSRSSDSDNHSAVLVDDQEMALYTRLSAKRIDLDRDSFIVVRESDLLGRPGKVLFSTYYAAGAYDDETIVLNEAVTFSEDETVVSLFLVVHLDTDGDGEFDPSNDDAAVDAAGRTIGTRFELHETAQSAHVRLSLSAQGNIAYQWLPLVDDVNGFDVSEISGSILLRRGWKYDVRHTGAAEHPLEFLDASGGVIWTHSGDSENFMLNVDEGFAQEVDRYRCRMHPAMTGKVDIQ